MEVILTDDLVKELQERFEKMIEDHLSNLKTLLDKEYFDISWIDVQNEIDVIKELESRIYFTSCIWYEAIHLEKIKNFKL